MFGPSYDLAVLGEANLDFLDGNLSNNTMQGDGLTIDPVSASQISAILMNNNVADHAYWVGNDGGNGLCAQFNFMQLEAVSCDKDREIVISSKYRLTFKILYKRQVKWESSAKTAESSTSTQPSRTKCFTAI